MHSFFFAAPLTDPERFLQYKITREGSQRRIFSKSQDEDIFDKKAKK